MRNFVGAHRRIALVLGTAFGLAVAIGTVLGIFGALARGHVRYATRDVAIRSSIGALPLPGSDSSMPVGSSARGVQQAPVESAGSPVADVSPAAVRSHATENPRLFAITYATAMFSYDTRDQDEQAWTVTLRAALDRTADVHPDNLQDVADRTPPIEVWAAMTRSAQHATFTLIDASVPQLWTQNAAQYPVGSAAITVTGVQHVWSTSGSSEVPSSVTLLLICPPYNSSCVINRIATQVLP